MILENKTIKMKRKYSYKRVKYHDDISNDNLTDQLASISPET